MMRLTSIIALAIFLFASCQKEDRCLVKGQFDKGMNGEFVIFPYQQVKSAEEAKKLTVKIPIVDGIFSKYLDSTIVARSGSIKMNDKNYQVDFFGEPGTIQFKLSDDKLVVKGGANNENYEQVKEELGYDQYVSLRYKKQLTKDEEEIVKNYEDKLGLLVETYPQSIPLSKFYWDKYWGADAETLEKVIDSFSPDIQDSYYLSDLKKRYDTALRVAIGKQAPTFSLPDVDNQFVSLEDFKGKYVLVDFWASWCGPCRKEIPNLKEIYKTFNDDGLAMISLSVDVNKEDWLKAVKQEEMPWHQIRDTKDVSQLYNISFIPHIILISPEGIILAKNLHGEDIWKALNEVGFEKEA